MYFFAFSNMRKQVKNEKNILNSLDLGLSNGAVFIFYWGIKTLEESKAGSSYTENNYTAIFDYKPDNGRTVPREYISKDALEEGR